MEFAIVAVVCFAVGLGLGWWLRETSARDDRNGRMR